MNKERLLKSRKTKSWTDLRMELDHLRQELKLSRNDFNEVNINDWKEIEDKIWGIFSRNTNSAWIWETLKVPYHYIQVDRGLIELTKLVDNSEKVWCLFNEAKLTGGTKFWVYESNAHSIQKIINESYSIDEIIITSKKYEWILVLNHHDYLLGTGEMAKRLKRI